jgi:HemY protein
VARLALLIGFVLLIAVAAAWLADHQGNAVLRWEGYEARASFAVLLGLFALTVGVLLVGARVWGWIRAGLPRVGHRRDRRRRDRGFKALSDSLIAVAAGDAPAARRLGREAASLLGGSSLPLLIEAQAAQASGDEAAAKALFETMLKGSETEFVALRSLTAQARKAGDHAAALGYVRRARALKPDAPWVLGALAELEAQAGHWQDALEAIEKAVKAKALPRAAADRRRADLLTARAREAARAGDATGALTAARDAHRLAPALIPAAALEAELLQKNGKAAQAAKVIEETWSKAPHPDLADLYVANEKNALARLKRLEALATRNPDHAESRIAVADAAIEAGLWGEARRWLGPLLGADAPARAGRAMAAIEQRERHDEVASRAWLERAASGAPDAAWLCAACGHASPDWAPGCARCGNPEGSVWRDRARPAPAALIGASA